MKTLLGIVAIAAGVSLSGLAQGALSFSYTFTNSGETVGPTDVVTLHTVLMNSPSSTEHLLGSNFDSAFMSFGSFDPLYSFSPGSIFSPPFPGLDLAPGGSFAFDFGAFTPTGTVPPGVYAIANSALGFRNELESVVFASNDSFSVIVTQAQLPEASSLALLGIALAGLGFARRRKLH